MLNVWMHIILGRGVPPGYLNPDPISDQKCHFSDSFSDITLKEFMPSFTLRSEQQQRKFFKSISSLHISLFLYSFGIETINMFIHAPSRFPREPYLIPSSETQGRSVGLGEKARRKFSSTGGKAPGYRLSPDHFQTVKRMLAPAWAQNWGSWRGRYQSHFPAHFFSKSHFPVLKSHSH